MSSTSWPKNVIARYLTLGGATVDITPANRWIDSDELLDAIAACLGCEARVRFANASDGYEAELVASTREARGWAQAHAETCRAMPRTTN